MIKEIKLHNKLLVNGETVDTLEYDTEEITVEHFAKAEGLKAQSLQKQSGTMMVSPVAETDYSMHLYLGFMAVIALAEQQKKSIDINDLKRIKGHDLKKIMEVGRNFMLNSEEDTTEEEDTEESTENTSESV
ncbi:MAG: early nodulin 20 (N-20) [Eubacterium sp.]|nr:early nodulin 20 (N-20) [Eubacterium sp.]